MALLQGWEMRQHLDNVSELRLPDSALQHLLDAAELAINDRIGPPGEVVETHHASGPLLPLNRRAVSVDVVIENGVTLDATDYALRPSGSLVERLTTGVNPARRWWRTVEVTYQTADDTADRVRVQIGLVKLDIAYRPGISSESIEGFTEASSQQQGVTYARLREEYLASLSQTGVFV